MIHLPAQAVTTLIRGYQRVISPMFAPRCRYFPSCSSYMVEAVELHGAIKGVALGGWRLLRCNPWSKGGIDRVPGHRPDEVDRIMAQMNAGQGPASINGRDT